MIRRALNTVDFNKLLMLANLGVAGLLAAVLFKTQGNPYIDEDTVWLAILLCAQTQLALALEKTRRDPFVLLLALEMIFYYSLRVFTLALYPFSAVFDRYPYVTADTNFALIFIITANLFLYAGLYSVSLNKGGTVHSEHWRANTPVRVALLMVGAIAFAYFSGGDQAEAGSPSRIVGFLEVLLSANIIVLMSIAYYFIFRDSLSRGFAFVLGLLIILDMVIHTITGSRSAIVAVIQDCILVGFATSGCIRIRRLHVLVGSLLLPVLLGLLAAAFAISTYDRSQREFGRALNVGTAAQFAVEAGSRLSFESMLDVGLPPIFARAGFLDFSSEIIAHRDHYREVINPAYYAKSIVDNLLTPGFDVFDVPKVSNALQFIYAEWGTPSKRQVSEAYQSDQFGIYGEFYALCGYGCLPLMFLAGYLFKRAYVAIRGGGPFLVVVKRVIVLYLFVELLRSFGLDWILIESVTLFAAAFLFKSVFGTKQVDVVPVAA